MPDYEKAVFCAFAGGGAKGIAHVGAVAALEEAGYQFRAVAGTSAGAIVAALVAAGYTSDQIIHKHHETTILNSTNYCCPRLFFNKIDWFLFRIFDFFLEKRYLAVLFAFAVSFLFVYYFRNIVDHIFLISPTSSIFGAIVASLIMLLFLLFVYYYSSGILSLKNFRDEIGRLLASKVFPNDGEQHRADTVTFKDLPNLTIVATNITDGEMEIFCAENTPDVPVADAIAASICVPFVFKPWRIPPYDHKSGTLYLDGGLVSNLPAWAFDDIRSMIPNTRTVAINIISLSTNQKPSNSLSYFGRAVRTAIFGGNKLNVRGIDGMLEIDLACDGLRLLELWADRQKISDIVADARKTTAASLNREESYAELPRRIRDITEEFLAKYFDIDDKEIIYRVWIGVVRNDRIEFRYFYGFDQFANCPFAVSKLSEPFRQMIDDDAARLYDLGGSGNPNPFGGSELWKRFLPPDRYWLFGLVATWERPIETREVATQLMVVVDCDKPLPTTGDGEIDLEVTRDFAYLSTAIQAVFTEA